MLWLILLIFLKLPQGKIDFVLVFSSMTFNKCIDSWDYQHRNEDTEWFHHPKTSLCCPFIVTKPPLLTSDSQSLSSLVFGLFESAISIESYYGNLLPWPTLSEIHPCCGGYQHSHVLLDSQYSILQMYYSVSICSPLEGHLICFQLLMIMNIAAINICEQPGDGIAGTYGKFTFNFVRTAKLNSSVAISFCVPTNNV